MSALNLTFGTAGVALALHLGLSAVLPEPKPIVVHDLRFDPEQSEMVQDRTVTTDHEFFYAHWVAQFLDEDGRAVCSGEGDWAYTAGRASARMSIQRWVGDEGCQLVEGEKYTARAAWLWGDDQEAKTSEPFIYTK